MWASARGWKPSFPDAPAGTDQSARAGRLGPLPSSPRGCGTSSTCWMTAARPAPSSSSARSRWPTGTISVRSLQHPYSRRRHPEPAGPPRLSHRDGRRVHAQATITLDRGASLVYIANAQCRFAPTPPFGNRERVVRFPAKRPFELSEMRSQEPNKDGVLWLGSGHMAACLGARVRHRALPELT